MTQREALAEPTVPRESPLGSVEPAVNWYLESTRQEAVAGRALINQLSLRQANGVIHEAAAYRVVGWVEEADQDRWLALATT